MGLFSFFRSNNNGSEKITAAPSSEIPKDVFIEEKDPQEKIDSTNNHPDSRGINAIYDFLQADYESKGFNDALANPDESYKTDNISLFEHDLQIHIQKATTLYEDMLKELDFHVSSRQRAGLIDLVEELKVRKERISIYLEKVTQIRQDAENKTGMSQRIMLSYQRGFNRGLSAITYSKVLN